MNNIRIWLILMYLVVFCSILIAISNADVIIVETGLGDRPRIYKEQGIDFDMGKCQETKSREECINIFTDMVMKEAERKQDVVIGTWKE